MHVRLPFLRIIDGTDGADKENRLQTDNGNNNTHCNVFMAQARYHLSPLGQRGGGNYNITPDVRIIADAT